MPLPIHGHETLNDPDHPEIRRILRLQQRAERERTGLFFAEGTRFVAQAVEQGALVEALVLTPEAAAQPLVGSLARSLRATGAACLRITPQLFRRISLAETPQGVGVVVRQRWETLKQIRPSGTLCWVCHEVVQSPGNLGAILRTCDAVGAAGVILIGDHTDPYDPVSVRATMGAIFPQRFVRATLPELAAWKRRHRCLLVGASPEAVTDYHAVSYQQPVVFFMGSERKGLTPEQRALCDVLVRIPMVGASDSLNVAIATSVLLYEAFNQRRPRPPRKRVRP